MGFMIFLPLVLLIMAAIWVVQMLIANALWIGIAFTVAAILSMVVLLIPGRRMLRATRRWVRGLGVTLIVIEFIAAVSFVCAAIVCVAVVVMASAADCSNPTDLVDLLVCGYGY